MTSVNPSPTPPSLSREDSVRSEGSLMATSAHGSYAQVCKIASYVSAVELRMMFAYVLN